MVWYTKWSLVGGSSFHQLSDSSTCTCPDDTVSVTYECTVMGGFGTIWTGSVVSKLCEDTGGRIFLLHSHFVSHIMPSNNPTITCDNGNIVGMGVRVKNDSFTSQLTATVSSNSSILAIGDNIVCAQVTMGQHM